MIPEKTDVVTCVLIVTATLLLSFVRCGSWFTKAP